MGRREEIEQGVGALGRKPDRASGSELRRTERRRVCGALIDSDTAAAGDSRAPGTCVKLLCQFGGVT